MSKPTPGAAQSKGNRPKRIAAEIHRDLPELLRRHAELPADLIVSITDVVVTSDLSHCKVFFSVIGTEDEARIKSVARHLNAKRGVLRTELAAVLVMRQHPELLFAYDEVPARAARIEMLLKQIRENDKPGEPQ